MKPQRVLVTGASRGIGRAVAERLLAEGRQVAVVARDASALEDLSSNRDACVARAMDLRQRSEDPVAWARAAFGGRIDGLVHAAGVAYHAPLSRAEADKFEAMLDLHVRVPWRLLRSLAQDNGPRSAVMVSSTLAARPAAETGLYAASKAALNVLVRTAALELADAGIRVNAIAPGAVDTDMIRTAHGGDAKRIEALQRLHPLGRFGTPDEIAEGVCFLLDSAWCTGTVMTLDGGLTAG